MKSRSRGLTGPAVRRNCLRLDEAIGFDNKRLPESRPEMIVTISRVIEFYWLATACDYADLEAVSKRWTSGFDDGYRYDLSTVNSRLRLVSRACSPTPVRTRSHL